MNQEEQLFLKRLEDLANMADRRSTITFTDFMNLNELNILHTYAGKLSYLRVETFGGYDTAERQMAAFIPDALLIMGEDFSFPIRCVHISPANRKFAEDLSHRDYLGAILNLGIDRSKTGDILVRDNEAWLFCAESMEDFIIRELTRVRHTAVRCESVKPDGVTAVCRTEMISGTVSSVRLDSVIALAFHVSRSKISSLIPEGCVYVNARLVISNGHPLKEGDLVSVRGMGRFRYTGVRSESRKGRLFVEIEKYV